MFLRASMYVLYASEGFVPSRRPSVVEMSFNLSVDVVVVFPFSSALCGAILALNPNPPLLWLVFPATVRAEYVGQFGSLPHTSWVEPPLLPCRNRQTEGLGPQCVRSHRVICNINKWINNQEQVIHSQEHGNGYFLPALPVTLALSSAYGVLALVLPVIHSKI